MDSIKLNFGRKDYLLHIEHDYKEISAVTLNSNNELIIDCHANIEQLNEQTYKIHFDNIIIKNKNRDMDFLLFNTILEMASLYCSNFHKNINKAPVIIISNATPLEQDITLPILQFYPARDRIYISSYSTEIENEWLSQISLENVNIDTYRRYFKRNLIPQYYFLNEEILTTNISGIFLKENNNYIFQQNDVFQQLSMLSPPAQNTHYKHFTFHHINMDSEHPFSLNAERMNLKNISKKTMHISGFFFNITNCNTSKININLDFLGESPKHSLLYLEKFRYSQLKVFQKKLTSDGQPVRTPFVFLKNCKTCDVLTRPTTFFIICDTHKEKYENRSIIVDASNDELYHKIIFLTPSTIEIENQYKQIISWDNMEPEERDDVLIAFRDLLPSLEDRFKLRFPKIEESILNALNDDSYTHLLNPKLMSNFLRNIQTLDPDQSIEYNQK